MTERLVLREVTLRSDSTSFPQATDRAAHDRFWYTQMTPSVSDDMEALAELPPAGSQLLLTKRQ
jgi:hypothetical protein